jgi:hypothetical protein
MLFELKYNATSEEVASKTLLVINNLLYVCVSYSNVYQTFVLKPFSKP